MSRNGEEQGTEITGSGGSRAQGLPGQAAAGHRDCWGWWVAGQEVRTSTHIRTTTTLGARTHTLNLDAHTHTHTQK